MFEVGPDDIDVLESAPVRLILDAPQQVSLHIYRIDTSRILKRFGNVEYVDAAARTKIGDLHSGLYAERPDVALRMREIRRLKRSISSHHIQYIPLVCVWPPENAPLGKLIIPFSDHRFKDNERCD